MNCPLQNDLVLDMGQVFYTYTNANSSVVKGLGIVARYYESYHGLQMALEAYLKVYFLQKQYLNQIYQAY